MKIKPYIGVPNLGEIRTSTVRFLLARVTEGYSVDTNIRVGHDIARNLIAKNFLETKCTHLWWIDSDIVVPDDFTGLFTVNKDIVTGAYPIRPRYNQGITLAYKAKEGGEETSEILEIDKMGLGCCVIKREVVEKVVEKHGMFCETQLDKTGLSCQSEDITFGEWAKELGYKMWLHKKVLCGHEKMIDFKNIQHIKN